MILTEVVRKVYTRKFSTFSGRAGRAEFWNFLLFFSVLQSLLLLAGGMYLVFFQGSLLYRIAGFIPALLFALVHSLPVSAVVVRRLHDCNLSGWWLLAALALLAVPVIGWLGLVALLLVLARGGSPEDNDYGRRPRGFSHGAPRVVPG